MSGHVISGLFENKTWVAYIREGLFSGGNGVCLLSDFYGNYHKVAGA